MRLTFRQGIVSYPSTGPIQSFLAKTGVYVTLQTTNGNVLVSFAHGTSDYLLTEAANVTNAWGPIPVATDAWLFWDIDTQTAVRTFGFTLLEPSAGSSFPGSPVQGQHFFNYTDDRMYLYDGGAWRAVIRVFAAKVNNTTFTPLGTGFPSKPFAGTQVGLTATVSSGAILFDEVQAPIRRANGEFFTTDSDIFTASAPASSIRLEASILSATALENMAAFQVVYFSQFGKVNVATYNDLQEEAIGITLEPLLINQTGTVILQGAITNPDWTWDTVGAKLWVDNSGVLVDVDPHLSDPITYTVGRPPIARVITPTTIYFDQGLGGKGDTGQPGPINENLATNTEYGIVRLSLPAAVIDEPIAVGDNDPRFDSFVLKTGDTMSGFLTLNANPTAALHAAPKQYVDTTILTAPYVELAGDTMTGFLTLNANPTDPLHAATKQYADNFVPLAGGTMTGFLTLNADPTSGLHAATKQYVDGLVQGLSVKPAVLVATEDELQNLGDVAATVTYNNGVLGVGATLTIQATSNPGVDPVVVTIDGYTLTVTDVTNSTGILVKGEAGVNAPNNGRYYVSAVSADTVVLTRCPSCDEANEIPSAYIFVQSGTLYTGTGWVALVANPGTFTVGTDDITWIQFSGAGTIVAGNGISQSGANFDLDLSVAELPAIGSVVEGADRLAIYDDGAALTRSVDVATFLSTFGLDQRPYDLAWFVVGFPTASTIVVNHVFAHDVSFADDFAGSQARAQIAATASSVFDVQRNGISIGSITFAAAATVGTYTTAGVGTETFAPGDVLTVVAPGIIDATLARIAFTLVGEFV